jgi:hypothetical protein
MQHKRLRKKRLRKGALGLTHVRVRVYCDAILLMTSRLRSHGRSGAFDPAGCLWLDPLETMPR